MGVVNALLFSLLYTTLHGLPRTHAARIGCLTDPSITTLEALVACYGRYTVPAGHYTLENQKYCTSQPLSGMEEDWPNLVSTLAKRVREHLPNKCPSQSYFAAYPAIDSTFEIAEFKEKNVDGSSSSFCVIAEKWTDRDNDQAFALGWGFAVYPTKEQDPLAPTLYYFLPRFDKGAARQATSLFKSTNGRVLFVNGRHPAALRASTSCIPTPNACDVRHVTDPIYDLNQPFAKTVQLFRVWQIAWPGCPPSRCAFLEFFRKTNTECPEYKVFLSNGLGSVPGSTTWYADRRHSARKLKNQLDTILASHLGIQVGLPGDDEVCPIARMASENTFGRRVNYGFNLCEHEVTPVDMETTLDAGAFLRIHQDDFPMSGLFDQWWTQALLETFKTRLFPIGGPIRVPFLDDITQGELDQQ